MALTLCLLLLNPLLKSSADLAALQIRHEKTQELYFEADRAFELIGRAIRMAGYRNAKSAFKKGKQNSNQYLEVQAKSGYQNSDALIVRHELSDGNDFDCIGNVLTKERTKNHLAYQGFLVNRQAALPKGTKANGGSLICQSLDRQGRLQNSTLMNGVQGLYITEIGPLRQGGRPTQMVLKVKLVMTDGVHINLELERIFSTRNVL